MSTQNHAQTRKYIPEFLESLPALLGMLVVALGLISGGLFFLMRSAPDVTGQHGTPALGATLLFLGSVTFATFILFSAARQSRK